MKPSVMLLITLVVFLIVVITAFQTRQPTPVILVLTSESPENPFVADEIADDQFFPRPTEEDRQLVIDLLAENFYGEVLDAGEWHWVEIVNPEPLMQEFRNGSFPIDFGDTCGIIGRAKDEEGGTIQVRGEAPDGRVLYEYTTLDFLTGSGCPCGVLFFGPRVR